ncbi:hypothetical protein ACLOJK_001505 [Asimina triloba]
MLGNRKRGRGVLESESADLSGACDGGSSAHPIVVHDPPAGQTAPPSEHQIARLQLRQRWELASVLHFLRVISAFSTSWFFLPIIGESLDVTAEEIETALISPNHVLAELHIALLKGIPPVSKNVMNSDAWVTIVCKKIQMWWQWVAEGDIPLIVDHGKEILRYKELDPTIRLLILKALCEIRSEQYDVSRYINDELRRGTELSTFRKDRMGGDGNGIAFWYDGDSILGHRLYRESGYAELKQQLKESFNIMEPKFNFKWETLATNLEEFRDILDKLSSSTIPFETAVGKTITNEIIPVLEKLQKKERALKRKQMQAKGLHDSLICYQLCGARNLRTRSTVCYTFDEFDRSIDEAIKLNNEEKMTEYQNNEGEQPRHAADVKATTLDDDDARVSDDESDDDDYEVKNDEEGKGTACDGRMLSVDNDDARGNDDDDGNNVKNDEEGNGCGSHIQDDGGLCDSSKENSNLSQKIPSRNAKKKNDAQPQKVLVLRRSMRTASRCHTSDRDVEETLGQWLDHEINYDNASIVPDSEDDDGPTTKLLEEIEQNAYITVMIHIRPIEIKNSTQLFSVVKTLASAISLTGIVANPGLPADLLTLLSLKKSTDWKKNLSDNPES